MEWSISDVIIQLVQGDITRQPDLDAIANAANSTLRGGGGVDGAIHKAAGPLLKQESSRLGPIRPGEAVVTGAYLLPNRYVIHCVGPVYGRDVPERQLLASCYHNAMALAEKKQVQSLGLPAISTGVYGYPIKEAAAVMVETLVKEIPNLRHLKLIRVVLFDAQSLKIHNEVFDAYLSRMERS